MAERKDDNPVLTTVLFPPRLVGMLADQVSRTLMEALAKRRSASKTKKKKKFANALFLDTSALIDGRILEVARLGFMTGEVVVAEFVLSELKYIADSEEQLRRMKGRRGLDILSDFKKVKGIRVSIISDVSSQKRDDIDDELIRLTKQYKGRLVTSDFNLNKKAKILGIPVLNVNELVNALRTVALPGEELRVTIVGLGKGENQGVGYLPDGTMIVVEDGAPFLGKTLDVLVSRTIQTAAGRMLFTKLKE